MLLLLVGVGGGRAVERWVGEEVREEVGVDLGGWRLVEVVVVGLGRKVVGAAVSWLLCFRLQTSDDLMMDVH